MTMRTSKDDEALFLAAGFSYEYPGFWDKDCGHGINATVSDGETYEGIAPALKSMKIQADGSVSFSADEFRKLKGMWSVQMFSDGAYLDGDDFDTAAAAITGAEALAVKLQQAEQP